MSIGYYNKPISISRSSANMPPTMEVIASMSGVISQLRAHVSVAGRRPRVDFVPQGMFNNGETPTIVNFWTIRTGYCRM